MIRKVKQKTQGWGYEFNIAVDFCVWILETDGLHVPPFDKHPNGDNAFQKQGLDAASWSIWLNDVILLQEQGRSVISTGVEAQEFFAKADNPPAIWKGRPEVGQMLIERWQHYLAILPEKRLRDLEPLERSTEGVQLTNDLKPYYKRLSRFSIYLVSYPRAVEAIVLPVSTILGIGNVLPVGTQFRTIAFRMAKQLVMARQLASHSNSNRYLRRFQFSL